MQRKKILITGAAGSIGSELYRQLASENSILSLDNNETALFDLHEEYNQKGCDVHFRLGDVRDVETVREVLNWGPDIVFHVAALKHVYPNELFPEEAVHTNVLGTINIVREARKRSIPRLVYISTDKVVNASCIMGATKKIGELVARNAGYSAVRFGNVMGSRGSVLPIWERQIARKEPITITDPKAERFFMSIQQAAGLVIEASKRAPGLFILDMGTRKTVETFANEFLVRKGIPNYPKKYIGLRAGETLTEDIMTPEETTRATFDGTFYTL